MQEIAIENKPQTFFFHGKESGPYGSKFKALQAIDARILSPDFQNQSLAERLVTAELASRGLSDLLIVGSSMGGLVTALLYQQYPERFRAMLLLAPALHGEEAAAIEALPDQTVVIHGRQDSTVPYASSKEWAEKLHFRLISVEDEHRLAESLPLITEAFQALLI